MAVPERQPEPCIGVMDIERRALTVGLLLGVSAIAFEAMAVATVLPAAVDDLGHLSLYGWAFSGFMLANLVATVIAGQAADRRGPALPYLAGLVLFGCGLVVAGTASVMPVFIAGRTLQGFGAGALGAIAYVGIGRGYPDELRARMLALLSSAWVLPALVGPALAGTVADRLSWRLVFIGLLPFLVLAGALMLPALRRMGPGAQATSVAGRVPSAVRLAAGAGLLLAGLGLRSPWQAGVLLIAGGLALAVPALRRLLPPGTLTARPGLPATIAARGLLAFGFFGAEAFLPLGLTSLRGLTTAEAGTALTATALTWTAGSWLQARLDARDAGRGRARRVVTGFAVMLTGTGVMAAGVLVGALPPALAVAGWGIAGLGMGLAYPVINLIALRHAPEGQVGVVSGSLQIAEVLCDAVAAGLGGVGIALGESLGWAPEAGLGAAYGIAFAGGLAGLAVARRVPAAPRLPVETQAVEVAV